MAQMSLTSLAMYCHSQGEVNRKTDEESDSAKAEYGPHKLSVPRAL